MNFLVNSSQPTILLNRMTRILLNRTIMMSTLNNPVLTLNRLWQAVNVSTVARAITLLWNESAKVVDPDTYQLYTWEDWAELEPKDGELFIQAIRQRIRIPEVVVLTAYDKLPTSAVTFSRRNVFKRDHWQCQYCGKQPNHDEITIDHITPRSRGGESNWTNCVLACMDCNTKKANMSLSEVTGMKLRKAPVKPNWRPMYARHHLRCESWSKFVSDAYWDVELQK